MRAKQKKRLLTKPISNDLSTVETNNYGILHLYCLLWLKSVLHLAMLQMQIQSNDEFFQKFLLFSEHIIKYSAGENIYLQTLNQDFSNIYNLIIIPQFTDLLRIESKTVMQKVQIYLLSYNPACYKYNTCKLKKCRFDFF